MTDIYIEISKLSDKFRTMCYGLTKDKEDIDNSVQELMLYFSYNCSKTFSNDEVAHNIANNKNISNLPNEEVDDYQWTKLEEIDKELDKLDSWYDKKIFELYYEGETLDSLAKKTGISRNSLFTTIDKVRAILKKELIEDN